ncbi:hypothetical protein LJC23_03385 [Desulfovibrio sp. OttesenSCG-928-I05]|nr:hypothetical protein [Desulfovibrio sp. OttesenSCG-928-I05]
MSSKRPVSPVKPSSMELIFLYACPFCRREIPLVSPAHPTLVTCDACRQKFPIVPVDQRSVHYVKIMLDNGEAAIDPDYM